MSKLKGDTIIGLRPDGSRLLNDGGKRAIERLRTNEALKEDLEQANKDKRELAEALDRCVLYTKQFAHLSLNDQEKYQELASKYKDKQ